MLSCVSVAYVHTHAFSTRSFICQSQESAFYKDLEWDQLKAVSSFWCCHCVVAVHPTWYFAHTSLQVMVSCERVLGMKVVTVGEQDGVNETEWQCVWMASERGIDINHVLRVKRAVLNSQHALIPFLSILSRINNRLLMAMTFTLCTIPCFIYTHSNFARYKYIINKFHHAWCVQRVCLRIKF